MPTILLTIEQVLKASLDVVLAVHDGKLSLPAGYSHTLSVRNKLKYADYHWTLVGPNFSVEGKRSLDMCLDPQPNTFPSHKIEGRVGLAMFLVQYASSVPSLREFVEALSERLGDDAILTRSIPDRAERERIRGSVDEMKTLKREASNARLLGKLVRD